MDPINSNITKNYYNSVNPNKSMQKAKTTPRQRAEKLKVKPESPKDTILKDEKRDIFDRGKPNYQSFNHINYSLVPNLDVTKSLNKLQKKANVYVALDKRFPIDKPYIEPTYFQDMVKEATENTLKIQLNNPDKVFIVKIYKKNIKETKAKIKSAPQDKIKANSVLVAKTEDLKQAQTKLNAEMTKSKSAMSALNQKKRANLDLLRSITVRKNQMLDDSSGWIFKKKPSIYDPMSIDPIYTFDQSVINNDKDAYAQLKEKVRLAGVAKAIPGDKERLAELKTNLLQEIADAKKKDNPAFYRLETDFYAKNPTYWIDRNDRSVSSRKFNQLNQDLTTYLDTNIALKKDDVGLQKYIESIKDLHVIEQNKEKEYKDAKYKYEHFDEYVKGLHKKVDDLRNAIKMDSKVNPYNSENLSNAFVNEIIKSANKSTELLHAAREGLVKGYQTFRNLSNVQYPSYVFKTASKALVKLDGYIDKVNHTTLDAKI